MTNWDNARFFLAVARAGTLRAAARDLRVDQATVGRRIANFEEEIGARLFLRTPSFFVLTPAGEAVLGPAEAIERSMAQAERRVMGLDDKLNGPIRVATTDSLGRHFVIPAISRMRAEHPDIEITCFASQDVANLTRREADVAIRTVRPEAPDLIVRRLATLKTGIYASRDYLAGRELPLPGQGFYGHDLVVYKHPVAPTSNSALCGVSTQHGRVAFQTTSTVMLVDAVVAGLGIAELPAYRADTEQGLVRIMPEQSSDFDVWLVAHADLNRTARVQALMSALTAEFNLRLPLPA